MIPLAHVGGLPVEELLTCLVAPGMAFMAARAWVATSLRRRDPSR